MNLSNEIIGGSLLIITICITLLVRYALVWYADIRNIRIRLTKVMQIVMIRRLPPMISLDRFMLVLSIYISAKQYICFAVAKVMFIGIIGCR